MWSSIIIHYINYVINVLNILYIETELGQTAVWSCHTTRNVLQMCLLQGAEDEGMELREGLFWQGSWRSSQTLTWQKMKKPHDGFIGSLGTEAAA